MSNVMGHADVIAWLNTFDYDSAGFNCAIEHAVDAMKKQETIVNDIIRKEWMYGGTSAAECFGMIIDLLKDETEQYEKESGD